jgi:hypothetical protein
MLLEQFNNKSKHIFEISSVLVSQADAQGRKNELFTLVIMCLYLIQSMCNYF